MFRKNKTINTIVNKKIENDNLVKDLRNQLKDGCKKSVIVFVDLCKSTDLKQDKDDIDWLCDIYSFINEVQTIGINNNGTIIKRIGDEIMLEFSNLIDSENFLTELDSNDLLNQFDYKIGCDYGDVYYFHYDNSVDDPYGTTVDRCARIIGLARGSVIYINANGWDDTDYGNPGVEVNGVHIIGPNCFEDFKNIILELEANNNN